MRAHGDTDMVQFLDHGLPADDIWGVCSGPAEAPDRQTHRDHDCNRRRGTRSAAGCPANPACRRFITARIALLKMRDRQGLVQRLHEVREPVCCSKKHPPRIHIGSMIKIDQARRPTRSCCARLATSMPRPVNETRAEQHQQERSVKSDPTIGTSKTSEANRTRRSPPLPE